MLTLKVVNLWGGPGAGKSSTAAGLFNLLKQVDGLKVELVTEFAKDLTYGQDWVSLDNQLYVLAEQDRRLRRLEGHVDYAIVDSPLPLGIAYMTDEYRPWLTEATLAAYERYVNYDFLLRRVKPYQAYGRTQTEHEALVLDAQLRDIFTVATEWNGEAVDEESAAFELPADEFAPFRIAGHLPLAVEMRGVLLDA